MFVYVCGSCAAAAVRSVDGVLLSVATTTPTVVVSSGNIAVLWFAVLPSRAAVFASSGVGLPAEDHSALCRVPLTAATAVTVATSTVPLPGIAVAFVPVGNNTVVFRRVCAASTVVAATAV